MKKNNAIIIILIVVVIYAGIMILVFNKNDKLNNSKLKYIVINNKMNLEYNNGKYKRINDSSLEKLNIKYKVYDNNNYKGIYYLQHVGNWNLIDDNKEFHKYDGFLLAFNEDSNVNVNNVNPREITDIEKDEIKEKYNINNFSFLINNQVYDIDIDNNGILDHIVCLTNSYYDSLTEEYIPNYNIKNEYSLIYVNLNGKINTIIKEVGSSNVIVYSIKSLYKANKISIILESIEDYISEKPYNKYDIWEFNNNKFVKVIPN